MSVKPLTPPKPASETQLVLSVSKADDEVLEEQALDFLPVVNAEKSKALHDKATAFITELAVLAPKSPEFASKVNSISGLGKNEVMRASTEGSRLLDRTSTSFSSAQKNGNNAQIKVAGSLADLRNTIDELSPYSQGLKGFKKALVFLPGSKKLIKYFRKYETSKDQLDAIITSLSTGQDELTKDNFALDQEKANLWDLMGELNEYAVLARALDDAAVEKIAELKADGKSKEAAIVEADVLFPIRQRSQDIVTQITVSIQGYLAMDLIKKNNAELIKGVERARTTTVSALKTAVVTAAALNNQKLVLDQIDSLNSTTNDLIVSTSIELKSQTDRIHKQASSSTIDPQALKTAFDNIFATMDAIDTFKTQANKELDNTVGMLTKQIHRTSSYLTRANELELEA